jgi:hypothetical protein
MSASPAEIPVAGATSPSQLFVINLCASTSPMALAQPNVPALKRYTFFVSRQRDDGRDRFRLHMGYFASQEEAEQLLEVVRDVYPAAWTGPAPAGGAPRRGRAAVRALPVTPTAAKPVSPSSPATTLQAPPPAPVAEVPFQPPPDALDAMSNVREVLAKLDDIGAPRMQTEEDAGQSALGESEVLRVLEASEKSVAESGKFLTQPQAEVRLVTPNDAQTLADIQTDADNNAPPCFAVQLVWSVSPIDVTRLPHLAIFDAYTLYNVEGNRDGRKWYGVRLGFFSDSTAATQVANYVRSDYRAVAIVPVAVKERDGAGGGAPQKPKAATKPQSDAAKPAHVPVAQPIGQPTLGASTAEGFKLLDDDRPAAQKLDLDDKPSAKKSAATVPVAKPVAGAASKPAAKPAARTAGKPTGKPTGKRVVVRKRTPPRPGAPNPLESTLEILGASTLTLDNTRAVIDDHAVRKPLERKSGGRFAKLLGRLSGN